jgi:hypothetical protein
MLPPTKRGRERSSGTHGRISGEGVAMSYAANALHVAPAGDDDEDNSALATKDYIPSLSALLSALSTVLGDTLSRFETISSRVTQRVLTRGDAADHDLIVALQDFDRLQQEFASLGDVISHCATVSCSMEFGDYDASTGHSVIADITLSDLKTRFLKHLQDSVIETAPAGDDEKIF